MMSLDEAIKHAEEVAIEQIRLMSRYDAASGYARSRNESIRTESTKECEKCAAEHRQLAAWLRESQEMRKKRDYWQEKAHSYEQTIHKLTDAISKQPEIIYCKDCKAIYCDFCMRTLKPVEKEKDYCSWAERRTDGT